MQPYADRFSQTKQGLYGIRKEQLRAMEEDFFKYARAIKEGRLEQGEALLREKLAGPRLTCALELLSAYNRYGTEGFWKSYEAYMEELPLLEIGRCLLEDEDLDADVGLRLSSGKDEEIEWLWEPYLAYGKMTMLDGDPGSGKTAIAFDLAARVTTGREMPGASGPIEKRNRGGVVLITPEDGLWDTIRPRLSRAGANLEQIMSVSKLPAIDRVRGYKYERLFTLPQDLPLLEQAIKQVEANLLIIDPLMAIMSGRNTGRDNDMRALLAPLVSILEKYRVACIVIRHLNKNSSESNALYRGGGSIAFTGIARSVLAVGPDPRTAGRNVMVQLKTNLGEYGESQAFQVTSDRARGDKRPYVIWEGVVEVSRKDVFSWKEARQVEEEKQEESEEIVIKQEVIKPISARQEVLAVLREAFPGEITRAMLARLLPEISLSTLSVALKRLIEDRDVIWLERGTYRAADKE